MDNFREEVRYFMKILSPSKKLVYRERYHLTPPPKRITYFVNDPIVNQNSYIFHYLQIFYGTLGAPNQIPVENADAAIDFFQSHGSNTNVSFVENTPEVIL